MDYLALAERLRERRNALATKGAYVPPLDIEVEAALREAHERPEGAYGSIREHMDALREAQAEIERLSLADAEDVAEVERLKASERTAWNATVVQAERHWAEVERLRALLRECREICPVYVDDIGARIDAALAGDRHDPKDN